MRKCLPPILCLAFCLTVLITGHLNAQGWSGYETTWHPITENLDNITIEYSDPVVCNFSEGTVQAEYIFLKITNTSSTAQNISFRVDSYYKGTGCLTCNNDEYRYDFNLPPNSIQQGDCDFANSGSSTLTSSEYRFVVFKQFVNKKNYREFEKFEITNITLK